MSLAYTASGPDDAPALLLLHPVATERAIWSGQTAGWTRRWRVVVPDLPGHGASPLELDAPTLPAYAASVFRLADALGIGSLAVVGVSFGGMVAQAMALAQPERVAALGLAHCGACTPPPVRDVWQARLDAARCDGMAGQVEPTLARWFTLAFAARHPDVLAAVGRMIAATPYAGYAAAVAAIQSLDHLDRLGALAMPTLVVAGDQDVAIPAAVVDAMVERLPNARRVLLAPAAHLGLVEQPDAFAAAVDAFLDDVPPW